MLPLILAASLDPDPFELLSLGQFDAANTVMQNRIADDRARLIKLMIESHGHLIELLRDLKARNADAALIRRVEEQLARKKAIIAQLKEDAKK